MERKKEREVLCKTTTGTAWVMCPVCRRSKILKLTKRTSAKGLLLFCRSCKHEIEVEISPNNGNLPRVQLVEKLRC